MKIFSSLYHTLRFWSLITILSVVLGTISLILGIFDRSGNKSHKVTALWSRLICKWNDIRVEITGMENIITDQPQIFIANHQGYYDIFALSGYLPVQLRWVSKSSLFRIPLMGWAMSAAGYIRVERNNRKKSYQAFLNTIETVKVGNSIIIFPEGTRKKPGENPDYKTGIAGIYKNLESEVLPVAVNSGHLWPKHIIIKKSGKIIIKFLKLIPSQ